MMQLRSESLVPSYFRGSAHIYRQVSATAAASLMTLSGGISVAHTAVLLPQLENDKSFPYDKTFDSWIASSTPLAMAIGSLFSGSLSDWIGRKMSLVVLTVLFIIGWIIMGFSINNALLLIARFILGICIGATRASGMVYIAELTDPKYRAIALACSASLAVHIGNLISDTVGKYMYWKYSCFLFALPNIMALVLLIFLKESPLWLLDQGKTDKGIESFRFFRGNLENTDNELALVLKQSKKREKDEALFKEIMNITLSKPFLKSLTTAFLSFVAVQWCGINIIPYYSQYIFQNTFSGDIDAFLIIIASDCIRIIANALVCIFAKFFPQKITLLISCYSTCFVLTGLSAYLYLRPAGLSWLALTCIIIFMITGTALTSIAWSFVAEIFPGKVRGFGSGISSSISFILLFISVKVTPGIMHDFGETAMYASFSIVTLTTGIFLMFLLPDTKGRTLQDIEDSLYKKKQTNNTSSNINMDTLTSNTNEQIGRM